MEFTAAARALHVIAIVHWIGGVSFVTLALLPGLMNGVPASERLHEFEMIENRFAGQARVSTMLAGLSGFYMTYEYDAWHRLSDLQFWWMHAMIVIWAMFTVVLYVAEPLFLHRWLHDRASRDPEGTFRLVRRLHVGLLVASTVTIVAAVLGAHGAV